MRSPTPPDSGSTTAPDSDTRVRQQQRFNWFAERMERWVGYYQIAELKRFASGSAAWPGQREKALVLLALTGTEQARRALESLEIDDADESFETLRQIAIDHVRIESDD